MATRIYEEVQSIEAGQEPSADPEPEPVPRAIATATLPTDVPPTGVTDEQALIEEARHRQRLRHRWISAVVAVAIVGAGLGLGLSFGTGSPATKAYRATAPSSTAPPPASSSSVAALNRPEALAIAADGELLIANQGTNQILRRLPNGTLKVVAGDGKDGYAGDGGPALKAELDDPGGMAVSSNGTIYVADRGNNRVRAISPSGTIRTVAGNGRYSVKGLSGPATHVAVPGPGAVALGSKGGLYVADAAGIQVISPSGHLSTVVHAGAGALNVNGARTAFSPQAIAVGNTGDLYVSDSSPKQLMQLTPKGRVVNAWTIYVTTAGLAAAPSGSILVADYGHFAVDRIVNDQLTVLTAFKLNSLAGLVGTFRPSGVTVTTAGQVYVDTDGVNGGVGKPAVVAISKKGKVQLLSTGAGHASH